MYVYKYKHCGDTGGEGKDGLQFGALNLGLDTDKPDYQVPSQGSDVSKHGGAF